MISLFTPVHCTNVNAMVYNYYNFGSAFLLGTPSFNFYGYSTPTNYFNSSFNPFYFNLSNNNYSQNVFRIGNCDQVSLFTNSFNPFYCDALAYNPYQFYFNSYPMNNNLNSTSSNTLPSSADNTVDIQVETSKTKNSTNNVQTTNTSRKVKTQTNSSAQKANDKVISAKPSKIKAGSVNAEVLNVANKYSNCKEADNSHLKFCVNSGCNKYNLGEWCTDFVTYVTKEAYKNKGVKLPNGFGDHDVSNLKNWAIDNGYFRKTSNIANKGNYIKQNIKPGDIFILNENGASHTGFVSVVHDDGSFSTIEGNRYDKVGRATYSPNFSQLSGFIQLS